MVWMVVLITRGSTNRPVRVDPVFRIGGLGVPTHGYEAGELHHRLTSVRISSRTGLDQRALHAFRLGSSSGTRSGQFGGPRRDSSF